MSGNPPRQLHPQALLGIYFASDQTLGEKSNFGPMFDRLETYGTERRGLCRRCSGSGVANTKALVEWLQLKAAYETSWPHSPTPYESLNPPPGGGMDCRRCSGTGYVIVRRPGWDPDQISVRPTGGSKEGGVFYQPDFDGMMVLATASRAMIHLGRQNTLHRKAIEAYYGKAGDWAEGKFGSRLFAVLMCLPKVRAGLTDLSVPDAMKKLKALQTNPQHSEEFQRLELKAQGLLAQASKAWSDCCESLRW